MTFRPASRTALGLLLVPPLAWLIVAYLGSLAVLLLSAFWSTDEFTGKVVRTFTTDNIVRVLTDAVFRTATLRTMPYQVRPLLLPARELPPRSHAHAAHPSPPSRRPCPSQSSTRSLWVNWMAPASPTSLGGANSFCVILTYWPL